MRPSFSLAALTLALALPAVVHAQILTVPEGQSRGIVEIIHDGLASGTVAAVYTVPAARRLVITDLALGKTVSLAPCSYRLLRNGAPATALLCLNPGDGVTLSQSFTTGISFEAGDVVAVESLTFAGTSYWTLRGYLTRD